MTVVIFRSGRKCINIFYVLELLTVQLTFQTDRKIIRKIDVIRLFLRNSFQSFTGQW